MRTPAHIGNLLSLTLIALAISWLLTDRIEAQFDTKTVLLNENAGFENGTTGWYAGQTSATILNRNWVPGQYDGTGVTNLDNNFFMGEQANLGGHLVQVTGSGVYGRAFDVNPSKGKHIFNAFALKQATTNGAAAGYASVGITYYDAGWNEVDHYEFPIGTADTNLNRGVGDGLNFYNWGIDVPSQADHAFIFGYTSAGTTLLMDNLALFQITNAPTASALSLNLVANADFTSLHFTNDSNAPACLGYGVEFWANQRDWSSLFYGALGSPNQAEWVYQFLPLKPGATYSLLNFGSKGPAAVASFGVDLYDANWNQIGKQLVDLTGQNGFDSGFRLEVPSNCAHASLFIWADRRPPEVSGTTVLSTVYELEAKTSRTTSMKPFRAYPTFGRTGQIGLTVEVLFSDPDGIDLSTIDVNDVKFTSKSSSATYPANGVYVTTRDNDRLVRVYYSYNSTNTTDPAFTDIIGIALQSRQVKDKAGNFAAARTTRPVINP